MRGKSKKQNRGFEDIIKSTPDVCNHYQNGLRALGQYSSKIKLSDTNKCEGSVDIDRATIVKYPQESRWDYLFSYKGKIYFVEVHSAKTGEVKTILKKLQWLKDWLHNQAPEINIAKADQPFYWIQSKGFSIPQTSSQYRIIVQSGLKPISILHL